MLTYATLACVLALTSQQQARPTVTQGDVVLRNFRFTSGETLPELRIHYRTLGTPQQGRGRRRAQRRADHARHDRERRAVPRRRVSPVSCSAPASRSTPRYFIILPDDIGHGKSSKPSDGLRARFPRYGYADMVEAQYRLLTEGLQVDHLRLVMGTSMGGMHTWLWGRGIPDFMDALMPLASLPAQIAGRNRAWRRVVIDAIRNDPEWKDGEYTSQPASLRTAAEMLWLWQQPGAAPEGGTDAREADRVLDAYVANCVKTSDANDVLYALEASARLRPRARPRKIRRRCSPINSADDLINPPELGILEREIKRVPNGRAIVLPMSDRRPGTAPTRWQRCGRITWQSCWSRRCGEPEGGSAKRPVDSRDQGLIRAGH